jgi:hypothetical protein
LGVPVSHLLMLGVTSTECVATLPARSLTVGPQSVSIVACENGQLVEGIGMLLYVTVLAVQLRRNSCISAWSPTLDTVYRKSAREMGAMPERALRSNLISTKSASVAEFPSQKTSVAVA